jgi:hypothetical protein
VTTEDRRAEIDRRFDETFAVFDERMRREQETVSRERAGRAGSAGAVGGTSESGDGNGAGGEGATESGSDGESGAGEEGAASGNGGGPGSGTPGGDAAGTAPSGSGQRGGGGGVGGGGPLGGAGPTGVPADIPDGRDDDIVARQLREAAMKETDPELRERLWDEYRKYKQGTS